MFKQRPGELNVKRSITFNPNVNYELIMKKLCEDFYKRWEKVTVSPETGLEGFEEKGFLGSGAFGRVILVKDLNNGRLNAVKILVKEEVMRNKQVAHVHQEKKVLESIFFPFTVRLLFSRKDSDNLYMGLPFVNGGELFTYHRRLSRFEEKEARFYSCQILLALEYLHNVSVIYRDLKPENILICANGYIKLTDFGFAKKIDGRTMTLCGTPEYLPPEIIQSKPYGISADYWSFGVLIYEFVNGKSPFSIHSNEILLMYSKICEGNYKMPAFFSNYLKDLISHLLQVDVSKRFGSLTNGVKDIKDHVWFQGTDWLALLNQEVMPPYIPPISDHDDMSQFSKPNPMKATPKSKTNRFGEEFKNF